MLDVAPPAAIVADVRDGDAVRRAAAECDVVVHNAALVPVAGASPRELDAVNVGGTRNALAAARAEGAYLLHISSTAIYGIPAELPVRRGTAPRPIDAYGLSKLAGERAVAEAGEAGILRPRTLVGPGRLGLFEAIFARVRAGRRVPMFGDGTQRIQLCDVEDFCAAALAAIARRAVGDWNVGAAEYGTVGEDLQALVDHAGTGARLQPLPAAPLRALLRALEVARLSPFTAWHYRGASEPFYCDIAETVADLGWEPRRSNAAALIAAYDAYANAAATPGSSAHRRPLARALGRLLR